MYIFFFLSLFLMSSFEKKENKIILSQNKFTLKHAYRITFRSFVHVDIHTNNSTYIIGCILPTQWLRMRKFYSVARHAHLRCKIARALVQYKYTFCLNRIPQFNNTIIKFTVKDLCVLDGIGRFMLLNSGDKILVFCNLFSLKLVIIAKDQYEQQTIRIHR